MKKTYKSYRRCPYCPQKQNIQSQIKCSCSRPQSSHLRSKAITSRHKRQPTTIIQNCSLINSTIPTMMAQCSALRSQNNHLKRQLLNVSTFLKQETIPTLTPSQYSLNQKLFIANKNLRETLLQLEDVSKLNKELVERNTQLNEQSQGFKIQIKQLQTYLEKYKRKCKKYSKTVQQMQNRTQLQQLLKQNMQLQNDNNLLRQEIYTIRFQNKNQYRGFSPQWVAHTNNKINKEHLMRVQQTHQETEQIDIEWLKKSLMESIGVLKHQNSHFTNSSFESISNLDSIGLDQLIRQLIQTYSEAILGHFSLLIKETNRKINNYERKLNNLTSKLQNFVMNWHNRKLKKSIYPLSSLAKNDRQALTNVSIRN